MDLHFSVKKDIELNFEKKSVLIAKLLEAQNIFFRIFLNGILDEKKNHFSFLIYATTSCVKNCVPISMHSFHVIPRILLTNK